MREREGVMGWQMLRGGMCALLACVCLAWSGCATTRASQPIESATPLKSGVYEVATGRRVDSEQFLSKLDAYRYVIVGERHDDPWHHEVQRLVYASMVARRDAPVMLGMEMFQRPAQAELDAYVAKTITEADMLRRSGWSARWGFDPALYHAMWRLARARGYRVVALNVRREVTRAVSKVGLKGLNPTLREALPHEIDLKDQGHRDWFAGVFKAHGMGQDAAMVERFYQAQVVWDEAMAERAFEALKSAPLNHSMLILAGSGHVMRGYGIPSRLRRRLRASQPVGAEGVITLIPISTSPTASTRSSDSPTQTKRPTRKTLASWTREGYADYVWVQ